MTKRSWLREYCEKTTSHGMQYFVMKHRSRVEKLFWILTFVFMMAMTFSVLKTLTNVWTNNPTVMFIENTESSIREIPFPSIMICPSNQLRQWVWQKYKNTNETYWENLKQYRALLCSKYLYSQKWKYLFQKTDNFDFETIKSLINDCAISCSEVFQSDVNWQNTTLHNFCKYVQPTITLLGLCFNINMMPTYQMLNEEYHKRYMNFFFKNYSYIDTEKIRWNVEDGYSFLTDNDMLVNVTPARTGGTSYYHRLRLMLHMFDDRFLGCHNSSVEDGFVLTINNPIKYYSFRIRSFILPDTYTKIQITPFVKKINKDLMWRSLEVRKCYLHNERKLSVFKLYSESNCNVECTINETISMCGCVSFEAVFLVTTDLKICGPSKSICILRAIQATYLPESQTLCNCLPTCSMIEYKITQTSHYDNWTYMRTTNLVKNDSRGATIEIVFKHSYFIAYKTASILGLDSLISTVGGTLSLLLGINLINIFEILYVIIQIFYSVITHMFNNQ